MGSGICKDLLNAGSQTKDLQKISLKAIKPSINLYDHTGDCKFEDKTAGHIGVASTLPKLHLQYLATFFGYSLLSPLNLFYVLFRC